MGSKGCYVIKCAKTKVTKRKVKQKSKLAIMFLPTELASIINLS